MLNDLKKKNSEGKELKDYYPKPFFLLISQGGLHYSTLLTILFFYFLENINKISIFYMRPETFVFSSNAARVSQKVGHLWSKQLIGIRVPIALGRFIISLSGKPTNFLTSSLFQIPLKMCHR